MPFLFNFQPRCKEMSFIQFEPPWALDRSLVKFFLGGEDTYPSSFAFTSSFMETDSSSVTGYLLSFIGKRRSSIWLLIKSSKDWLWMSGSSAWLWISGSSAWLWMSGSSVWLCIDSSSYWLWISSSSDWDWTSGSSAWLWICCSSIRLWISGFSYWLWICVSSSSSWSSSSLSLRTSSKFAVNILLLDWPGAVK